MIQETFVWKMLTDEGLLKEPVHPHAPINGYGDLTNDLNSRKHYTREQAHDRLEEVSKDIESYYRLDWDGPLVLITVHTYVE